MEQYRQPTLGIDAADAAVRAWFEHAGLRLQSVSEPVDGVVEYWANHVLGRIKWGRSLINQGAILALLRSDAVAAEDDRRRRLLFTVTGFTPGAVAVANSQEVALYQVEADATISPLNEAARRFDPGPIPEPVPREVQRQIDQAFSDPVAGWTDCPQCGTTHHPDANYCAVCGADFHQSAAPLPPSVGQPIPAPAPGGPTLRCRTCGSHDIELIKPD